MKNIIFKTGLLAAAFLLVFSFKAAAVTYQQEDGLFSVDIPEGWAVREDRDKVVILNKGTNNGIAIAFRPIAEEMRDDPGKMLRSTNKTMMDALRKDFGCKVLSEKAVRLGGVYARRIDYMMPVGKEMHPSAYIVLYKDLNGIITAYSSGDEDEKESMEQIVETMKF